jgi:hypothetical protein
VVYKNGQLPEVQTISKQLGEDNVKRIINWVMKYLADVDIPIKVCSMDTEEAILCFVSNKQIFIFMGLTK